MSYALFDIETKIDWDLLERVEDCEREVYLAERMATRPSADIWIPHSYHLPIAIAVGLIDPTTGELIRLGCVKGDDSETVCREFWNWLDRFQARPSSGTLVSFNGRSFDLPVLELAALRYAIQIPHHYAERYGNRYRYQEDWHLDVYDYLGAYGATRHGSLSLLSTLIGMPAKDVSHSNLEEHPLELVQAWCRNDVRRLFAVFQRLQYLRGRIKELAEMPELEGEGD